MPEKLQIVKPMEGSATLHHWQRLATPHMAGIFEERDGVQIKHEQPFDELDSTTYSVLDVEEEGRKTVIYYALMNIAEGKIFVKINVL